MSTNQLVENFFRHEFGRLVSLLSCRVGANHLQDVEDAVQSALATALEVWAASGPPENPSAWLFKVARNKLLGELRQRTSRRRILEEKFQPITQEVENLPEVFHPEEVSDDLLRMMFVCCDDTIPQTSQTVLILKTLCGFDVREIALRLFTSEANVYKRISRARSQLKASQPSLGELSIRTSSERLPAIHRVLYLLFTEGHLSSKADFPIRRDLCDESIRLTTILANHPVAQVSETFALLALMHLQMARMDSRLDRSGGLLLLEEQDRSLWDRKQIEIGLCWLAKSASGERFTRYHAEAGIAAEHCMASSFQATRWKQVAESYEILERLSPSPLHTLNRAIAVSEWKDPEAGMAVLQENEPPSWLSGSYLWSAVLADLHRRKGDNAAAKRLGKIACQLAPTPEVERLLRRRLKIA